MTLRELIKHFYREQIIDICTPSSRRICKVSSIEESEYLDSVVSNWNVNNENVLCVDL